MSGVCFETFLKTLLLVGSEGGGPVSEVYPALYLCRVLSLRECSGNLWEWGLSSVAVKLGLGFID